jgi:soluble lytic murein transglycosylase
LLRFTFHILLICFLSTSCISTKAIEKPYQQPTVKQVLKPDLTLKAMIDENKLAIDYESKTQIEKAQFEADAFAANLETTKKSYGQAIDQTCAAFSEGAFCQTKKRSEYFSRTTTPRFRLSSAQRQSLQKNISSGKFELIQESPEAIIAVISRFSNSTISNTVQAVLKSEACYASSLYYAVGYVAETLLPGSEQLTFVLNLYNKGVNCATDEASARAAYRLALFHMNENKCKEAAPLFDRVLAQEGLKPLHSRSLYWSLHCKGSTNPQLSSAEEAYLSSPLSFHGLLGLQEAGVGIYERIQKNPEPLAVSRTQSSETTNQVLRVAEFLIANGQKRGAKNLLLSLSFDDIYKESPELAIYVSYLFHRLDEGLLKFQGLATVLSRNPHLKTPTTMKLFYPKWHFELVEKYAKAVNLDPYLVMALIRQESAFHVNARSGAKAMGLMQILPSTARTVDRRVNRNQLFDPETNVRLGTQYLARGIKKFDGNIHMTLAAYNAGGGIIGKWIRRYPINDALVFSDLIPYRETREYVGSIMRNYYWYKALYENQEIALRATNSPKKVAPVIAAPEIPVMVDVIPPTTVIEEAVIEEPEVIRDDSMMLYEMEP